MPLSYPLPSELKKTPWRAYSEWCWMKGVIPWPVPGKTAFDEDTVTTVLARHTGTSLVLPTGKPSKEHCDTVLRTEPWFPLTRPIDEQPTWNFVVGVASGPSGNLCLSFPDMRVWCLPNLEAEIEPPSSLSEWDYIWCHCMLEMFISWFCKSFSSVSEESLDIWTV